MDGSASGRVGCARVRATGAVAVAVGATAGVMWLARGFFQSEVPLDEQAFIPAVRLAGGRVDELSPVATLGNLLWRPTPPERVDWRTVSHVATLGLPMLLVALPLGVWRARSRWAGLALALIGGSLALGPRLVSEAGPVTIGGRAIALPAALLDAVAYPATSGMYYRAAIVGSLGLSVLLAGGPVGCAGGACLPGASRSRRSRSPYGRPDSCGPGPDFRFRARPLLPRQPRIRFRARSFNSPPVWMMVEEACTSSRQRCMAERPPPFPGTPPAWPVPMPISTCSPKRSLAEARRGGPIWLRPASAMSRGSMGSGLQMMTRTAHRWRGCLTPGAGRSSVDVGGRVNAVRRRVLVWGVLFAGLVALTNDLWLQTETIFAGQMSTDTVLTAWFHQRVAAEGVPETLDDFDFPMPYETAREFPSTADAMLFRPLVHALGFPGYWNIAVMAAVVLAGLGCAAVAGGLGAGPRGVLIAGLVGALCRPLWFEALSARFNAILPGLVLLGAALGAWAVRQGVARWPVMGVGVALGIAGLWVYPLAGPAAAPAVAARGPRGA